MYYLQSRYYDPEIGRFINADAYAATGQSFVGNNMFVYCLNNPVCLVDPNGMCSYMPSLGGWVDCKKWWCSSSSAYLSLMDILLASASAPSYDSYSAYAGATAGQLITDWRLNQNAFENANGTFMIGIAGIVAGGPGGGASVAVVGDGAGNLGIAITPVVGAGTYNAGWSGFASVTDAPTIFDLKGKSKQYGGSLIVIGVEKVEFTGANTGTDHEGYVFLVGPVEYWAEGHVTFGNTFIIPLGNVRGG